MAESKEKLEAQLAPFRDGKVHLPDGGAVALPHGPSDSVTSIRQAEYRGKKIEIHTTYKVTIDGEPLRAHMSVNDQGQVHYHALPNYSFPSAVDMARKVIDSFSAPLPDDELNREPAYSRKHKG